MAIEVLLTADGIGLAFKSTGLLTGQDLLDCGEHFRVEVERNPAIRYVIMDHSEIAEQKVDVDSLQRLAIRVEELLEPVPEALMAIVAPNDVLFGLSRMWESLAVHPAFFSQVVRTRGEALGWLRTELARRRLDFNPEEG